MQYIDRKCRQINRQDLYADRQIDGIYKQIDGIYKQIDGIYKQIDGYCILIDKQIANICIMFNACLDRQIILIDGSTDK